MDENDLNASLEIDLLSNIKKQRTHDSYIIIV